MAAEPLPPQSADRNQLNLQWHLGQVALAVPVFRQRQLDLVLLASPDLAWNRVVVDLVAQLPAGVPRWMRTAVMCGRLI